ncbi:MAG: hypothetical protein ACLGHR_10295 [Gammaproteobacteria bacterium]
MSATTLVKAARSIVASGSNAAGSTTRGTIDLRTSQGGLLTGKITNGATGPTLQCEMRILVAHNDGATPAAAPAGADWKTIQRFGGGTTANAVTEFSFVVDPGTQHLEVEFTGNTGQAVTVEAGMSEITNAATV